jgi:MFS family permease
MGDARRRLPENVRALGWVSFANDLASELVYPVLPLFLKITLGAPVAVIGLIEGVAEGVAVALRGGSGFLSDRIGGARRTPWIFAGYAMSAVARPVIALAPAWGWVLGGRVADRLGKATRTAPRDALIFESTPPGLLGAAFGYHRALDTLGAVVGPLVALAALALGASLRTVLLLAVVPGFATLVVLRRVREAPRRARAEQPGAQAAAARLPGRFWAILAIWTIFSLGNSSDVFLILRAYDLGLTTTLTVLAYVVYNVVYSGLSWPLGALSDRIPRPAILAAGLAVFALVYLGFAFAGSRWVVWPLFAVYGLYIAATEGVARALVGDAAGEGGAGTAYGIFAAATGAALLAASVTAGLLWSRVDPSAPFYLGAATAAVALALLLVWLAVEGRRPPVRRTV